MTAHTGARLAAVEGTDSYEATITHALKENVITVVEVKPPRKSERAGVGKTDAIDATAAAMSILHHRMLHLCCSHVLRAYGPRSAPFLLPDDASIPSAL